MNRLRLTPLGSRITTTALSIGAGTSVVIYIWVVVIGGHGEAAGPILFGALIALLVSLGVGFYSAQVVSLRVKRIEDAARKVADGDFAARIPVDSSSGALPSIRERRRAALTRLRNSRIEKGFVM